MEIGRLSSKLECPPNKFIGSNKNTKINILKEKKFVPDHLNTRILATWFCVANGLLDHEGTFIRL